jgi:long-chain acyl-CoA synthetase
MKMFKDCGSPAIAAEGHNVSYAELVLKCRGYASLISEHLVTPAKDGVGPRVAVISENRNEWIYATFGSWISGAVTVPVDFLSTPEEIRYIVDDCRPDVVFFSAKTSDSVRTAVASASHKPVLFDISQIPAEGSDSSIPDIRENDISVIIYTSGTTGSPKGVMLTFANMWSLVDLMSTDKWGSEYLMYGKGEVVIGILPYHHVYPLLATLVAPLASGSTVCIVPELTGEAILATCVRHGVTRLFAVPRLYAMFHAAIFRTINAGLLTRTLFKAAQALHCRPFSRLIFGKVHRKFGGKIKGLYAGGSKMDPSMAHDFETLGFNVLEGYGMSECSPCLSYCSLKKHRVGTVGWGLPIGETKIVDGEFRYKGPNVMKGYYNRPEETAAAFDENGFLRTGDTATIGADGFITITGRIKELIILSNGKNINPEEIENEILAAFPIVKEVAVMERDAKLFAVIFPDFSSIARDGIGNISETLRWEVLDRYNSKAAHHKKILDFAIVESELPRTRLGKIRRHELAKTLSSGSTSRIEVKAPETEEYEVLAEIVSAITGKQVLAGDHIELDLGMDSLDRVELQTHIEKVFGMELSNEDLSRAPRLAELASLITERKTRIESEKVDWGTILAAPSTVPLPKSSFMMSLFLFVLGPVFLFYFRIRCEGLSELPQKGVIFAPNHQSAIDGLILAKALRRKDKKRTYFFAKDRHFATPFRRFFARNANIVLLNINRDLRETVSQMASVVREGRNAVIFPEGARSRDGQLQAFKKSFAVISEHLRAPVVPVVIDGAFDRFPIGKRLPRPGTVTIRFLDPVLPDGKGFEQISEETRQVIEKNLPKRER